MSSLGLRFFPPTPDPKNHAAIGSPGSFALAAAAAGLACWAFWAIQPDGMRGVGTMLALLWGGSVAHAFLPLRARLPFFVLLTFAAIILVFPTEETTAIIAGGLALIGACHLPVAFGVRCGIVMVLSGALAAFWANATAHGGRLIWGDTMLAEEVPGWVFTAVPILGTLFMFRLAVYLYDLRHERQPVGIWQRIGFFFLLPNPFVPLFPVVDYKTYLRTYYDAPAAQIYRKGALWMARGVIHLILYRAVYMYLVPVPEDITGLSGVLAFMLAAYLLYLRVSGLFHFIVGSLCLFGFNLPETHRLYLLASGFNDYWRRINIYWKDFMMKLVYYPSFMRLRKLGMMPGLLLSTALVFAATWLLHAYQIFWLSGRFPLPLHDALFWGVFGVLVIINTAFEAKRGPRRKPKGWSWARAARLSAQTAAMLVLMCLLWSMWYSANLSQWVAVLGKAGDATAAQVIAVLGVLAAGVALGTVAQYLLHRGWRFGVGDKADGFPHFAAVAVPMALVIAVFGYGFRPAETGAKGEVAAAEGGWLLGKNVPGTGLPWPGLIADLRGGSLNEKDRRSRERGYYEEILGAEAFGGSGMIDIGIGNGGPKSEGKWYEGDHDRRRAFQDTGDLRGRELIPNDRRRYFASDWTTNSHSMRDREYALAKPPGTYRIAMLGTSYTVGQGVDDEADYESLLEVKLNEATGGDPPVEVLNFALSSYSALEAASLCEVKVPRFGCDAVFLISHGGIEPRVRRNFAERLAEGVDLQFDGLRQLAGECGIEPGMAESEIRSRLAPRGMDLVRWVYGQIAKSCRARGSVPVWVFVPRTDESFDAGDIEEFRALAAAAGLETLVLPDPYAGRPLAEIIVHPTDEHPNELGHQLIAEALFAALKNAAPRLGLALK